jgi:hypothetical protein
MSQSLSASALPPDSDPQRIGLIKTTPHYWGVCEEDNKKSRAEAGSESFLFIVEVLEEL